MSVVRMPDGALVRFPDDMPADQIRGMILKKFPDAAKKAAPEDEPKEGSVLDVPLQVAKGLSSGVRGITDILGAENVASKGLRKVEGYLGELLSAQGKDDQTKISQIFKDAEDKGIGAQLRAAFDALKTAPVSAVAQGLGTAIPTIAGGAYARAAKLGKAGILGTQGLIGAAMGTGMIKGSIYDAVNQQLLDAGATEEQAAKAASQAQAYTGDNLGMIGTGGFLGAITGGTGIEPALAGAVSKNIAKSFVGRVAVGAVAEGIPEVVQGGQERLAQNLALQNAGFDVPTTRGVVGAGAYEGLVGGVLGGGIGAIRGDRSESRAVQEPVVPPVPEDISGEFTPEAIAQGEQAAQAAARERMALSAIDTGEFTEDAGFQPDLFAAQLEQERRRVQPVSEGETPLSETSVPTAAVEEQPSLFGRYLSETDELARMQAEEDLANATTAEEKQAAEAKLAALRQESEFESLSLEQGAEQSQVSEASRRAVLLDTIQNVPTNNYNTLAANFSRALTDQGFARVEPTEAELSTIKRAVDVQRAEPEVPPPAPPLQEIRTAPGGATELEAQIPELAPSSAAPVQPSFPGMGGNRGIAPERPGLAPETPATPAAQTITPELFDSLGVSPQAPIRKRVMGKDLSEPAVRQQFVDFTKNQKVGQEARLNIARMLEGVPDEQMELFQPRRPAGEPRVAGREPSVSDVGREAGLERVAPEATGADRTRVGDVGTPAEPVGRREDVKPSALETAKPTTMGEPLRATGRRSGIGRVFTGENAQAEADAAFKARGPQGITAARAKEMGDPYYRSLQRAEGETDAAEGMFSPLERLIRVALDSKGRLETLHHEAIHAMRDMGLFKDPEWAALSKRAKDEWIAKYEIKKKYKDDNLTEEQEIEEAVAEAYADYVANKNQGGKTKTLFDRMRNLLRAVMDAVRGAPEDVFRRIEKGEVGRRERKTTTGDGAKAPMVKGTERYTRGRDAERAQVENSLRRRLDELGLRDVALKVPDSMTVERGDKGGTKLQRTINKQVEEAQTALDKIRESRTPKETAGSIKDIFKSRSAKEASAIGARAYKSMAPAARRAWLWVLPTEDVFRNAKGLVGDRIENIDDLNAAFNGADALRNKLNFAGQKISDRLGTYQATAKGGDFTNLEDVILGSTLEQVDLAAPMPKDASRSVKELYDVWKTLPTEARTLYKDIFDFFDTQKNEQFRLTLEDMQTSALPKELKEQAIEELKTQFKDIAKIKRYFPLSRPGKYWLRSGNGADYQMRKFETAMARNAAQDQYVEKLKAAGDKRDIDTLFADKEISTGDDMHSLRLELENRPDTVINRINKIIKNASDKNAKEEIADSVFQLYMDSLAGTDATRHWAPRSGDGTVGFSTDINRVFSARAMAGANHLARLAYYNRISDLIGGMYEAARGRADSDTLMPFIDTMAARARRFTDPLTEDTIWDTLAQNGNKVVWIFMLTAPRSGILNIVQVPGVAMPVMAASIKMPDGSQLGFTRASAALAKNFGTVFATLDGSKIKGRFAAKESAAAPRLGEALGKIYEQFEEEGRFSTTFMSTMNSIARGPSPKYAMDPWSQVGRGTTAALNWITAFFQMTESRSRQLVAMATAEIEYTNAIKSNKFTHDEAVQIAKNSALKVVGEGMFNYAGVNRSELMTGGSGQGAAAAGAKIATQFSAYTTFFTSHIFRNAYTMFKGLDKAERKEAATKLFGTLGMVGMFGGVQGLGYLYGSIMAMLDALGLTLKEAGDDDDDDQSNPLLNRNADQWFKEHFLPTYFGPGSGLAKTFGLDKKSADALVSSIYSGPISALTGANFSTGVRMELPFQRALPFDSIFFSEDLPDITDRNAFESAIFHLASGPSGGLITQWQSGLSDLSKGDFLRGAEQMVPAIARGPIRSMRFATEGSLTREGAEIKGKEGFTPGMLLKQSVGFSDTRLDELQRARFLTNKAQKQIDAERDEVYFAFDRAVRSGSESAFEKAREALRDFNAKNPRTPIYPQQVTQSVLSKGKGRASAISGAQPSKRFRGLTAEALGAYDDEEE